MSTEEKIYNQLAGDDAAREILRVCKSPASAEEIMVSVWRYYRDVKGMIVTYDRVDKVRDIVGTRLNSLEKIGAIIYDASLNKWKTQEIALRVMRKYFGMV